MDEGDNPKSGDARANWKLRDKYSLRAPAEEIYEFLSRGRQQVIDVGRDMASVTIPSVFPPDGYQTGDRIGENNQSFGALCVNTLASKLMFMAMSPFRPILRFQVIEHKLQQEIDQDPELWSMVQEGLSRLEIEHRNRLEATQIRSRYVGGVKALIVGGNILWDHMEINSPQHHLPTTYVVKRNTRGEPLFSILAQKFDVIDLDEDVQDLIYSMTPELKENQTKDYDHRVTIHRVCKRCTRNNGDHYWEYWEEYKGHLIEGTSFDAKFEEPPLYPAWMIPIPGQNWGRSYCEEYRGDLFKVETLESAINDAAAAASLILMFLKPGSPVSMRQIKEAENLSLLAGSAEDLSTFNLDKQADLNFIDAATEKALKRLGRAFLVVSSIQRDAERVTAEEWGRMAQEIDEAMGGLYSELGQSFQSHVIRRFVALHNDDDKKLPKLPEGVFRVAIISAVDAMGRTLEGENLVKTLGTAMELGKEEVGRRINWDDFMRRLLTSASIETRGLLKTPDEVAGDTQKMQRQAMMQEALSKGIGPAINQAGGAMQALAQNGAPQPTPQDGSAPTQQDFENVSPPPPTA